MEQEYILYFRRGYSYILHMIHLNISLLYERIIIVIKIM